MVRSGALVAYVTKISDHIVALMGASAIEAGGQRFLRIYGYDFRTWPSVVLILIAFAAYCLGLATSRAFRAKREAVADILPTFPVALSPIPVNTPERPMTDANWRTVAVVGAVAISAFVLAQLRADRTDRPQKQPPRHD